MLWPCLLMLVHWTALPCLACGTFLWPQIRDLQNNFNATLSQTANVMFEKYNQVRQAPAPAATASAQLAEGWCTGGTMLTQPGNVDVVVLRGCAMYLPAILQASAECHHTCAKHTCGGEEHLQPDCVPACCCCCLDRRAGTWRACLRTRACCSRTRTCWSTRCRCVAKSRPMCCSSDMMLRVMLARHHHGQRQQLCCGAVYLRVDCATA